MRRYFLPVASLPLVALACFDRLGDDPQFDGGAFHFDAGDGTIPDGALPDVAPEAAVDAGPLPVKVTVLRGGAPEPGVTVVFQDATGAVVEAKTTAADGTASRLVDTGTMVTVALGAGNQRKLFTVLGVKPGDALTALDDPDEPFTSNPVSADVPASPPANAVAFQSRSGNCLSASVVTGPTSYSVSPPTCERHGKFPVLTLARDSNGALLGFASKKGNVLVGDAGTTQVTGLSAWGTTASVTITATNASSVGTVPLEYNEIADGVPFSALTQGRADGGVFADPFTTYPGYADAVQLSAGQAGTAMAGALQTLTSIVTRATPPAPATKTFDLTQLLPACTSMIDDTTTDPTRPSETVSFSATPTGADGIIAQMSWSTMDPDAGFIAGKWIIVGPPTTTVLKAPALPTSLASWAPGAMSSFDLPFVVVLDSDQLPGYDQLRAVAASFPAPSQFLVRVPPLPSNGTLRFSMVTPGGG